MRATFTALTSAVAALALLAGGTPLDAQEADDETRVKALLLELHAAQERFANDKVVNLDGDGVGEFGTLQELAGTLPPRAADGKRTQPVPKPYVPQELGAVDDRGEARIGAYLVKVFLVSTTGAAVHETKGAYAAGDAELHVNLCESTWCAYAWPAVDAKLPTFCIDTLGTRVRAAAAYVGAGEGPEPGAAFAGGGLERTTGFIVVGGTGQDGREWWSNESVPGDAQELAMRELIRRRSRDMQLQPIDDPDSVGKSPAMQTNERIAQGFLNSVAFAQQFAQADAPIDVDKDGKAEFACLQELAGTLPLRTTADGSTEGGKKNPDPFLGDFFGKVDEDGVATIRGYCFRLHLPGRGGKGLREAPGRACAEGEIDTDLAETMWCLYAWPERKATGRLTFATNQTGVVAYADDFAYVGVANGPEPGAAFEDGGLAFIGKRLEIDGAKAQDGRVWRDVRKRREPRDPQHTEESGLQQEQLLRQAGFDAQAEQLAAARRRSWELSAISTLRTIGSSQAQFQTSGIADIDNDGTGEFGGLQELAGTIEVRTAADGSNEGGTKLYPTNLMPRFGKLDALATARRRGYRYKVFLPGPHGKAMHEAPGKNLAEGEVDPQLAERVWCVYAWPAAEGPNTLRTFFTNERGDITASPAGTYGGKARAPEPGAALLDKGIDNITGDVAIDARGQDGNAWDLVN